MQRARDAHRTRSSLAETKLPRRGPGDPRRARRRALRRQGLARALPQGDRRRPAAGAHAAAAHGRRLARAGRAPRRTTSRTRSSSLGQEPPSGRQLLTLRFMGLVAPPPGASILAARPRLAAADRARRRPARARARHRRADRAALRRRRLGRRAAARAILVVVVALGVLALFGRRRQAAHARPSAPAARARASLARLIVIALDHDGDPAAGRVGRSGSALESPIGVHRVRARGHPPEQRVVGRRSWASRRPVTTKNWLPEVPGGPRSRSWPSPPSRAV